MLPIKLIRENPELVKSDLRKRGQAEKLGWVDELLIFDKEFWELKRTSDELRHTRNVITREISELKKEGKNAAAQIAQAQELPDKIKEADIRLEQLEQELKYRLMRLPNILHPDVPAGKDSSDNVELRRWGEPKKFDFELTVHGELAENAGLAEFNKAAEVSGSGFAYLKGELALLDLALQRFAIDHLTGVGFTLVEPPLMLRRSAYEGVTDLAYFENVLYKIEGEDLFMIATSEHPIVAMHMNDTLDEKDLPLRYVGVSTCFRKEIGSHGVDTRGLFRMHQFNKVEQVVICKPEDSERIHEEIQQNSEKLFQKLGIPYRVVSICTSDIGDVASKKYDIEAWFPREQEYKEVTSASNCTSYQAARLNIRYRKGDEKECVHTLNNTGIATSRAMRAILENFQNEDGTVEIPKVLQPHMNGLKRLGKKQ